jgi:hypothetical protein
VVIQTRLKTIKVMGLEDRLAQVWHSSGGHRRDPEWAPMPECRPNAKTVTYRIAPTGACSAGRAGVAAGTKGPSRAGRGGRRASH